MRHKGGAEEEEQQLEQRSHDDDDHDDRTPNMNPTICTATNDTIADATTTTTKSSVPFIKSSGYRIKDLVAPLTPNGSARRDFSILPSEEGSRKTLAELETASRTQFYQGRTFLSPDHLHVALQHLGMGYFGVVRYGCSFECSLGPDHHKKHEVAFEHNAPVKKSRGKGKSSLKLGCQYRIKFQPIDQSAPKGPIKITGGVHTHDKCEPVNPITYQSIIKKSHSNFFGISDEVKKFIAYMIANSDVSTDPSTIRRIAEKSLPPGITLNPSEVWNLKTRINKFLPTLEGRLTVEQLNDTIFHHDESIWDEKIFCKVDTDASMIANEVYYDLQGTEGIDHTLLLEEYLQNIKIKDESFTYKFWKDTDDKLVGCCWMTSHMRSNCERFGCAISIDAMKRGVTDMGWPYISVTGLNEAGKVCLMIESIIIVESQDAYHWLISNMFKMCPMRKPDSYHVVFGDGFFSAKMIRELGFTDAHFIRDRYHLRENVKDNFKALYDQVKYCDRIHTVKVTVSNIMIIFQRDNRWFMILILWFLLRLKKNLTVLCKISEV